jgi:hypothetical protein
MLWGLLSNLFQSITHNEELAAKRALEFAEVALLKQDLDAAYQMMSSKARSYVPRENFKDTMAKLHPEGYPTTVTVVSVEPVKGAATVYVRLRGNSASGQSFDYQFMLNGTEKSDYNVSKVNRF